MKNTKIKFTYIFLALYSIISTYGHNNHSIDLNCFTIIVGKEASECGSVIVAHNEDDSGNQIVNLFRTEPKLHTKNEKVQFANGGTIDQIDRTNGFIWIELPGMKVADAYLNDEGVMIASNGCPSREDLPDSTDGGILYWVRRLVA